MGKWLKDFPPSVPFFPPARVSGGGPPERISVNYSGTPCGCQVLRSPALVGKLRQRIARFQLQDEAVSERTAGTAIVPLITVQIHRLLPAGLAHALWIVPIGLR